MNTEKKIISVCFGLSLFMTGAFSTQIQVSATQSRKDNFSKDYTLTGIGVQDILNVAVAQTGKTGKQLGYSEEWCADFVSDCADLAGQSAAVPRYGQVTGLKNRIIAAGGKVITSYPQPGDIVFYKGHVEIVYSASGSSLSSLKSVGGNTGSGSSLYTRKVSLPHYCGTVLSVVRPAYYNQPVIWYENKEPGNVGDVFYAKIKNHTSGWYLTNHDGNAEGMEEQADLSQIWKFERQPDVGYQITSLLDDTCLDVEECAQAGSGSNVLTWTDNDSENQRFYFYEAEDAFCIRSQCSEFALEMDFNTHPGNVFVADFEENREQQKFDIEKILPEELPTENQPTIDDAIALKKYLQKEETFTEEQFNAADWNQDGEVNIYDLILLKKQLLEQNF